MFYFDPLYIICAMPALLLGILASLLMKYWSSKYQSIPNSKNLTGYDAMQKIVTFYSIEIDLKQTSKHLGDHYNPRTKTLALSREVIGRPTIASIAIVAHELGHAKQHQDSNVLMSLRTLIVPAINIGTNLGLILIFIGFFLALTSLAWVGLIFFSGTVIFSLLTLPIEIDASSKGLRMIRKLELLDKSEIGGAKNVLTAAALTYVAAAIGSISTFIYFFLRVRGNSRK